MLRAMSALTLPPPDFDPAAAYPEITTARAALAAHDWPSYRRLFDSLDWAGRWHVVANLEGSSDLENFLRWVVREQPDDAVAAAVLGTVLVTIGWNIRTGSRAKNVSADQFRQFHDYLRKAEQFLIEATARDPGLAVAWAERLATARGLELGQSEARRRYDQLAKADPHNLYGQRQLLQQLCPKWSGSFEAMHAFARECMLTAPPGAPNAMLVADAQFEHWADLKRGDDTAYVADPKVIAELNEAADRSIFSPQWTAVRGWAVAMNLFAVMFSLTRQYGSARRCFLAIGPYAVPSAWNRLKGGREESFLRLRQAAFQEGTAP